MDEHWIGTRGILIQHARLYVTVTAGEECLAMGVVLTNREHAKAMQSRTFATKAKTDTAS